MHVPYIVLVLDGLCYFICMPHSVVQVQVLIGSGVLRGWSITVSQFTALTCFGPSDAKVPHGKLVEGILAGVKEFSQLHLQVFPAQLPVNLDILANAAPHGARRSPQMWMCPGEGRLNTATTKNPEHAWFLCESFMNMIEHVAFGSIWIHLDP